MNSNNDCCPPFVSKHCCKRWMIPFIILAVLSVKSILVFYLWNALIPELFNGPVITFLQAAGLLILSKLFWGFGGARPGAFWGPFRHRARFAQMSVEEREKLRQELKDRCC